MRLDRHSSAVRSCLTVVVLWRGAVVAASPPAAVGAGSRMALAVQLNEELKTQGATLRNEINRRLTLSSAAKYDHLLGHKEEFVRYQEKSEAEAAAAVDPENRIRPLRNIAHYWSIVEPDRARGLWVRIEREIEALPADKRNRHKQYLVDVYFELGDFDKAIACAQAPVGSGVR